MSNVADPNISTSSVPDSDSDDPSWIESKYKDTRFADVKFIEKSTGKFCLAYRIFLVDNEFFNQLFDSSNIESRILPFVDGFYIIEVVNLKIAEIYIEYICTGTYDNPVVDFTNYDDILEWLNLAKMWLMDETVIDKNFTLVHRNLRKILNVDITLIPILYNIFEKQSDVNYGLKKDDNNKETYEETYTFGDLVNKMLNIIKAHTDDLGPEVLDWNISSHIKNHTFVLPFLHKCIDIQTVAKYITKFSILHDVVTLAFLAFKICQDASALVQLEKLNQFAQLVLPRNIIPPILCCIIHEIDKQSLRKQLGAQIMSILHQAKQITSTKLEPPAIEPALVIENLYPFKAVFYKVAGKVTSKSIKCKSFNMIIEQPLKIGDELLIDYKVCHSITKIEWEDCEVQEGLPANEYSITCADCHEYDLPNKGLIIYKMTRLMIDYAKKE